MALTLCKNFPSEKGTSRLTQQGTFSQPIPRGHVPAFSGLLFQPAELGALRVGRPCGIASPVNPGGSRLVLGSLTSITCKMQDRVDSHASENSDESSLQQMWRLDSL